MRLGWWCRLGGDDALLVKIGRVFTARVVSEAGEWHLAMPEFGSNTDSLTVSNAAEHLVRRMAAVVNIFTNTPGEVRIDTTLFTRADGTQKGTGASLFFKVTVSSAEPSRVIPHLPKRFARSPAKDCPGSPCINSTNTWRRSREDRKSTWLTRPATLAIRFDSSNGPRTLLATHRTL